MGERSGVRVLHRDAHLLVLSKPPWLATTAPDGGPCLVTVARELDPDAPRVHPSSRLDTETSGVVVFARTRRATRALLEARRRAAYRRVYLAVASGRPEPDPGAWRWSIARDPRDPRKRQAAPEGTAEGKRVLPAESLYRVAACAAGACVVHVRPQTGRTHQIRVHAAAAGVPLLGDVYYGGPRRTVLADGRVVTARRVMLHCAAVAVPDPVTGAPHVFRAEVPDDLRSLWAGLGGAAAALEASVEGPDEGR